MKHVSNVNKNVDIKSDAGNKYMYIVFVLQCQFY